MIGKRQINGQSSGTALEVFQAMGEYFAPLDILVQGYDASVRLQRGEDPFPGEYVSDEVRASLKVPAKEQSDSLFDLENIGICPESIIKNYEFTLSLVGVLNNAAASNPELKQLRDKLLFFASDPSVNSFFRAMSEKRYDNARNPELYTAFRKAYTDVMNECNAVINGGDK